MILDLPEAAVVIQADVQTLYQAAVADRLAGRNQQAVTRFEQVLAARPDDVDARLNLGLALLALGRLDEAETAFRQVVARAPRYADAWVGLIRVQQRRGDLAAARQTAEEALVAAPADPSLMALRGELQPRADWRLDLNLSRSRLPAGLPDWTEVRIGASRSIGGGWRAGAAVEVTERFGERDTYLEGRVDHVFADGLAYVAVGGSLDADYRPELALLAGGERRLTGLVAGTLDASVANYPSGTVSGLHPGVRLDLAQGRLRLVARWINLWDETGQYRDGYAASARWLATDRLALRAGYADAPESSEGVTVDVRSWHAGLDFVLSDRVTLRGGYVSEDRGSYEREELSVGISWRF